MSRQIVLERNKRVPLTPGGIQRDAVDIAISCLSRIELGRAAQLAERLPRFPCPHERKAKRMMQSRILR